MGKDTAIGTRVMVWVVKPNVDGFSSKKNNTQNIQYDFFIVLLPRGGLYWNVPFYILALQTLAEIYGKHANFKRASTAYIYYIYIYHSTRRFVQFHKYLYLI